LEKAIKDRDFAIAFTESIVIGLSNFCNLAAFHKKCPLHLQWSSPFCAIEPIMLSTQVVMHILNTLAEWSYTKDIGFSVYNEPLLDPRLCHFVYTTKTTMPKAQISIWTNGIFLTREFAEELHELGVTQLVISPYQDRVKLTERFHDLPYVSFTSGVLDDRLKFYTQDVQKNSKSCGAPLRQIVVSCRGDIGLCCMDWKWTKTFGNLYTETLSQILEKPEIREKYNKLASGIRDGDPCQRCQYTR